MPELALAREQYRAGKNALFESLATSGASTRAIRGALQKLSRHTDATLQKLWALADFAPDVCLVAAGGYGRGELFPRSDVDVLLLLPDDSVVDDNPQLKTKIESFISNCWDTGLEIGSSVRTLSDCAEEAAKDVTVQTSLLEARLLAGSKTLFTALIKRLDAALDAAALLRGARLRIIRVAAVAVARVWPNCASRAALSVVFEGGATHRW